MRHKTLEFGFFAPPIATQLKRKRVKHDPKQVANWQKDADAILRLKVRGYITERVEDAAIKKLARTIFARPTPTTGATDE